MLFTQKTPVIHNESSFCFGSPKWPKQHQQIRFSRTILPHTSGDSWLNSDWDTVVYVQKRIQFHHIGIHSPFTRTWRRHFCYFHRRAPVSTLKASLRNARQSSKPYYPKVNICLWKCSPQNVFSVQCLSVLTSSCASARPPLLLTASQRSDHGSDKLGSLRGGRHQRATKRHHKWQCL